MPSLITLTTTTTKENAKKLESVVIKSALSACIQKIEVASVYVWGDKVENANEIKLIFKTSKTEIENLIALIKANHEYENPEIIYTKVKVSKKYKKWYKDSIEALKRANIL
ncbi:MULTISPECIES: divalent cation tolerance protein CutA [Helicobacter]|uniref:Divalent cation tolerance protein CutA n=1 Tax=Helicobacter ibis TaxID=2962633 RepID=A0ABT4VE48_9HELI|nr:MULTISPECIES: divalent cation tolerance protein CutA [Helicobacter]MDA3966417.1 divalent cation tolerance protein CutA [Helicobacter sp. WB40]MDA3968968.1 divalent cation tolerance protein CutA [Helicobacter ibis]